MTNWINNGGIYTVQATTYLTDEEIKRNREKLERNIRNYWESRKEVAV